MSDNEQLLREVNKMADKKNEVAEKKSAEIIAFDPTMFEEMPVWVWRTWGKKILRYRSSKSCPDLILFWTRMRQPARVTYTIPSQEPFTAARRASRSFRVPISVGSSNGPLEALERAAHSYLCSGRVIPKTERSAEDNKEYVQDGSGEYIEETHQHFVIVTHEDGSSKQR